jgi:hypothetical protein
VPPSPDDSGFKCPAHSLSLKSKLSLFTALLFVSTVMVLAFKLEREVRSEFETALTAHQFSRVQRIADSLDNATRDRLATLAEAAKSSEAAVGCHPGAPEPVPGRGQPAPARV